MVDTATAVAVAGIPMATTTGVVEIPAHSTAVTAVGGAEELHEVGLSPIKAVEAVGVGATGMATNPNHRSRLETIAGKRTLVPVTVVEALAEAPTATLATTAAVDWNTLEMLRNTKHLSPVTNVLSKNSLLPEILELISTNMKISLWKLLVKTYQRTLLR